MTNQDSMNPLSHPYFDSTPGHFGDFAKVIPMIVVDSRDGRGLYRKFYTTDGAFMGIYRTTPGLPLDDLTPLEVVATEVIEHGGSRTGKDITGD